MSLLAIGMLSAGAAQAAVPSLVIGSGSGVNGATVNIPITFTQGTAPNPTNVAGYQTTLSYDNTRVGLPVITAGAATCTLNDAAGTVDVIRFTFPAAALPNEVACTIAFPITQAAPFTINLTHTGTQEFADVNAAVVAGTFGPGAINVISGPAQGPTVTYTPAPNAAPATVTFGAAGSIGGTTTSNIAVSGAGGQNGGTTRIDQCQMATGTGISFPGVTTMVCTAGGSCTDGTDANITATCTATAAAQTGTFTCRETRQNEQTAGVPNDVVTTQTWGFTCPAANVAPTITPATANGGSISTSTVGQGQTSTATISFTAAGGSGTSTSQVTGCSIGAPFSLNPANPTLTFTGSTGPSPQSFQVQCTAGAAAQGPQNLTCTVGGAAYSIAVTCPAGLPVAPPTLTATPAQDADGTVDGTAEVTFAAPVGLAGNATSTINLDVSGGIDDGNAPAETISITGCAITNNAGGNLSIATQPAATAFGTGDAVGDVDTTIGLRCNGNAAATTGELRCTVNTTATTGPTTATRLWELACPQAITAPEIVTNPASPATIPVQGQPGNTVAAQVAFTNTGDAPLNVTGCAATVDAAGITFTPPASPIAINGGTGTLAFSCTAPSLNTTITETVVCDTNDADEATVSFTLNCTGANLLPIPAVNGLGKALLAALVIGMGLIGLGLGRRTV